jgi:UDP-2,4-diacetamido-2,4,6-trideoxy-beta-L-altropyranose hydrolase
MPRAKQWSAAFVADAGRHAGLGHLSRSGAIAIALRSRGFDVSCLAHGADEALDRDGLTWTPVQDAAELPVEADVLIVDSYRLSRDVLEKHATRLPLVVLQEQTEPPRGAALIVNVGADSRLADRSRLYGFSYACLRPAFWGIPKRLVRSDVSRILVTTGSGAARGNAETFATVARMVVPGAEVRLIAGPYSQFTGLVGVTVVVTPDCLLAEFMEADLCVSAGGQTLLEAAATGTPTVAVVLAENQREQARRLAAMRAVHLLGDHDADEVGLTLAAFARQPERRRELSSGGQAAIDGYGALRVAFHIARLVEHTE